MPHVLLNGSPYAFDRTPATWHALLETIDQHLDAQGQTVATVRFDGIDEPAFRDAGTLARALDPTTVVEVEADTPAGLIARSLDEAVAAVADLSRGAVTLAQSYRLANATEANPQLALFAQTLGNLMALIVASSQVLHVSLRDAAAGGQPMAAVMTGLDAGVTGLLEAHAGEDWITLADSLEYDIAPAIGQLRGVLDHLAAHAAAADGTGVETSTSPVDEPDAADDDARIRSDADGELPMSVGEVPRV